MYHPMDRAFDLKMKALHYTRDISVVGGPLLHDLLEPAVPFLWHPQAVAGSQAATDTMPLDVRLQPNDLIETHQFWVYPEVDDLPTPTDGHVMSITAAALLVDWNESLLLIRFISMMDTERQRFGPFATAGVSWAFYEGLEESEGQVTRRMKDWTLLGPGVAIGDGEEELYEEHRQLGGLLLHGVASQFWLKSKVAALDTQPLSRGARRRAQRSGILELGRMHVITLRHPEPAGSEADRAAREYTRRWLVAPHWRNQYLPSTGQHRPTPISEYIKGPKDKPLIVRPRGYDVYR